MTNSVPPPIAAGDEPVHPVTSLSPQQVSAVAQELLHLYFRLLQAALRSSAEQDSGSRDAIYPRLAELKLFSMLTHGVHNMAFLNLGLTAYGRDSGDRLLPPMLQDTLRRELEWLYARCAETAYPQWWLTHRDRPFELWQKLCDLLAYRLNRPAAYGIVWRQEQLPCPAADNSTGGA